MEATRDKLIDFINKYKLLAGIVLAVAFWFLYYNGYTKSIRLSVGNILTVSSIILGLLGVFLGLLIASRDQSFFKRANEYGAYYSIPKKRKSMFEYILLTVRNNFTLNLLFILLTVLIDIVPSVQNQELKSVFFGVWSGIFAVTLWNAFYIVQVVVKIILYRKPESIRKTES